MAMELCRYRNFKQLMNASSRGWTPTRIAASRWRKCWPSFRGAGDECDYGRPGLRHRTDPVALPPAPACAKHGLIGRFAIMRRKLANGADDTLFGAPRLD